MIVNKIGGRRARKGPLKLEVRIEDGVDPSLVSRSYRVRVLSGQEQLVELPWIRFMEDAQALAEELAVKLAPSVTDVVSPWETLFLRGKAQ